MSARQLTQVGLVLLGGYLIVTSLASIAESFSSGPLVLQMGDDVVSSALARSIGITVAASTAWSLVFGVAPGILIIRKSHIWSEAWIPAQELPAQISTAIVLQTGLLLLGLFFAIDGLATLVGGASQVLVSGDFTHYGFKSVSSGVIYLLGGIIVFYWGRRLARDAA